MQDVALEISNIAATLVDLDVMQPPGPGPFVIQRAMSETCNVSNFTIALLDYITLNWCFYPKQIIGYSPCSNVQFGVFLMCTSAMD